MGYIEQNKLEKLTEEELTKLAEQKVTNPLLTEKQVKELKTISSPIERFILALDIKSGKTKVLSRTIYQAYRTWAIKPLTSSEFFEQFSRYFLCERTKKHRYYKLNQFAWQLTIKAQEITQEHEKKY